MPHRPILLASLIVGCAGHPIAPEPSVTTAPPPVVAPEATATAEQADGPDPDWDHAVQVAAFQVPGQLVVQLDVGDGFHVYGANETISRPLALNVDQLPTLEVTIPPGEEKDLGEALGTAWVLEGRVLLTVPLPADAPVALSGALAYQVCTDNSCIAPTSTRWTAQQEDDR